MLPHQLVDARKRGKAIVVRFTRGELDPQTAPPVRLRELLDVLHG